MLAFHTALKYARAATDGITSIITVATNEAQSILSDEYGRLWSRIFVNGAALSTTNPLPVFVTSSSSPLTWVNASALANSGVIKAAAGELFTFYGLSTYTTSKVYFHVYNTAAVPADGAVPVECLAIPIATGSADSSFSLGLLPAKDYGTGISWALSSTAATKTLVAGSHVWVNFGIL